jgi:protein-tyrosine-phosphatase
MPYVLVVCTANICRSPMAAALLRHALAAMPEPLRSLEVLSAGVAARQGDPATDYSSVALRKVGISLASHRSRPVTQELLDGATAVLVMTESHRSAIRFMAQPPPENLLLFREFMPPGHSKEIADPYGGSVKGYEATRDEIVEAIPSVVEYLGRLLKKDPRHPC